MPHGSMTVPIKNWAARKVWSRQNRNKRGVGTVRATHQSSMVGRPTALGDNSSGSRNRLTGGPARGPRPLKVVAAQPAGDVHGLADEIEVGHRLRHHAA